MPELAIPPWNINPTVLLEDSDGLQVLVLASSFPPCYQNYLPCKGSFNAGCDTVVTSVLGLQLVKMNK